jgi:NMD protein affecting ribosome stability and mRNA decay
MTEPTTYSGRYKKAHPEKAREYNRRANAKRPDRDRDPYRPCPQCGNPRKDRDAKLCLACARERDSAGRIERRDQIEVWWCQGLTMRQIAAQLGWDKNGLSWEMNTMRKAGYDLPYRRRGYE